MLIKKAGLVLIISCLMLLPHATSGEDGYYPVGSGHEDSIDTAQDLISSKEPGSVSFDQPTELTLGSGQKITVSGKVDFKDGNVARADSIKYNDADISKAEGFEATNDGYKIAKAERLVHAGNLITGGVGITFQNNKLTAEHADSFIKAGAVGTNIEGLEADATTFSVITADIVQNDCVSVNKVIDSVFSVYSNALEVKAQKGVNVSLTDCSFNDVTFESNDGKVLVNKQIPPVYFIENGTLVYRGMNYTEKVEANNSAKVEMDPQFGFSCMSIRAVGTYWYNHNDMKKDFGVHVPAVQFRLCLKKSQMQKFSDYDGLVDFTKNEIFLSKIVDYLKYPFRNNQMASLLMTKLFEDEADYEAYFKLDNNFVFIDSLLMKGKGNELNILNNNASNAMNTNQNNAVNTNKNDSMTQNSNANQKQSIITTKTITPPNNYLEIKEKTIGNEVHRLAKINPTVSREQLEDSRIIIYKTDYFNAKITIKNNITVQENKINRIDKLSSI